MRIAIDFDGTIAARSEFWPKPGALMPGVKAALCRLADDGHMIIVWSSRVKGEDRDAQRDIIIGYMYEHGLPFFEVDDGRNGKVMAEVYIDDKAIRYCPQTSGWADVLCEINRLKSASGK